jgi:hypothetical protein
MMYPDPGYLSLKVPVVLVAQPNLLTICVI